MVARSRTLTLTTSSEPAITVNASASSPILGWPATTAIVAGTAPPSRTACSISRAMSRLAGRGRPWLMMVLSSATTGRPAAIAAATSG